MAHFELTWRIAQSDDERQLLLDVERRAARALAHDLREHVRKQGAEFKDEPKGAEGDAWRRALWLTGDWPAPAAEAPGRPRSD